MSKQQDMALELGIATDGEGNELYDTAVIYFTGEDDESQIEVQAPNAPEIARRIVKLWNDDRAIALRRAEAGGV